MKQFVSPQDFLEYVQRIRANPRVVSPLTSEQERFKAMTEEQLRKHGIAATEEQLRPGQGFLFHTIPPDSASQEVRGAQHARHRT